MVVLLSATGRIQRLRHASAQGPPLPPPITRSHSLGGFSIRRFPHSPGGWASEMRVWAGLVPAEASVLSVQTAGFSLHPHVVTWCLRVLISSYKDTSPTG